MKNTQHFLSTALLLLLATMVAACGEQPAGAKAAAASAPGSTASAAQPADTNMVKVAPDLARRLTVVAIARAQVAEPLAVVGRLDFNEQSVARVGATVTGRVTELLVQPGQRVSAGAVLAQLNSAELGTAQLAYLKAKAHRELAHQAAERAKLLLAADVIGSAEAQRRQSELQVADIELRAAADQLRVMGMAPKAIAITDQTGAITSLSTVVSTVDGVVVERNVNRGQVVQPADVMFTVADIGRLWAVAQVPESMAARVAPGQKVRIEIPSNGVEPIEARLDWVADIVNPETRTVTVRAEIDNRQRKLRPAMLATMVIEPLPVERLVVPAAAVVRENDADHVFLKTAEHTYRLVPVKLGVETDGVRPVEAGLQSGQQIVVDGSFHLNNERNRAALGGS